MACEAGGSPNGVAAACFPDEPPHDDDHLRERHPEIDHPPLTPRTPHELLVGEDLLPHTCSGPSSEALMGALPVAAVSFGHVRPVRSAAQHPQHSVYEGAVIRDRSAPISRLVPGRRSSILRHHCASVSPYLLGPIRLTRSRITSEADVILNVIAVVERDASEITQGEEKIRNFDTKATAHRRFCGDCGCHMFLYVDPFPEHVLIHVPTLDRDSEVGGRPDRWVFTESKHPLLMIPADDLPRYPGWEPAPAAS